MIDWKQTTWGDVCVLSYGKALKGYQDIKADIPVFGTNGQIGWWHSALQEEPGVIVGRKGAYRGVHISSLPFYVIDTAYALKPSEYLDARWAYYCLLDVDINSMDSGSAIPSTNRDEFYAMPLLLPSIREQREIAATLGALDDKIELNRKTAATLEEMARALYKSWFVDFDPVVAKSEGRQPAFMDAETAALFPDSFDDDGLPVGWMLGSIADIAALNPGKHTKKSHPDTVRYVDLSNTKWGTIESVSIFDWDNAPSRARMVLLPGDTVVGTVRPANGSYSYISEDGLTGSTGFAVLRPLNQLDAGFVYLAATAPETIKALANLADGGAYPAVRPEVVVSQDAVIAPESVRAAFAEATLRLLEIIELRKRENQTLAELRDTLLPKLMSGELRAGEAKEQEEDVA